MARKKVLQPDGVVNVKETEMQEALHPLRSSRAKRPGQLSATAKKKSTPAKKATATAREQMYSIEDAADFLGLSDARVRGLIRNKELKVDRVTIAVDEGSRPRTVVRIKRSVLAAFKDARKAKDLEVEQRKQAKLNRQPRERRGTQYIAVLTTDQVRMLRAAGFDPQPRFGNLPSDLHAPAVTA